MNQSMMYLKTNADIFLVVVGAVLELVCVMSVSTNAETNHDVTHTKLAKLFDYESYKKEFDKSYDSDAEESSRRCLFYARAMAAFVSGVNYKYRAKDFYLALNAMSDWTPEEKFMTENKRLHKMVTRSMDQQMEKPAFMPNKDEKPEETLRKFLEERADDPIYEDLLNQLLEKTETEPVVLSRRKRETDSEPTLAPRDFSFDKLIHSKGNENVNDAERPKLTVDVNEKYEYVEPLTYGITDQLVDVDVMVYEDADAPALIEQLESSLGSIKPTSIKKKGKNRKRTKSVDQVFVDHSQGGCMFGIRNQKKCGSCYAFSATAIAEWLYCKKSGVKVAFSEQYIIDCAKAYEIPNMFGCRGGTELGALTFMETLGMELRSNIKYEARETFCPHLKGKTDTETTGYIRMNLGKAAEIPMSMFDAFLNHMPLSVVIKTYNGFSDYGGGVDDGSGCLQALKEGHDRYHAVVMVGHGIEGGQEYWLIRNSYGTDWGEKGYYKMSKNVDKECILAQNAYAFGTKDGLNYQAQPHVNDKYKGNRKADITKQKKLDKLYRQLGAN